jgi:signal peptidase I
MSFALILVLLTVISGGFALADRVFFAKAREARGEKRPWLVEQMASFFPIFLIVLLLRSFLIEPFRIPSGSLQPSLLIGDFVAVNKFAYGLRLPVLDKKVFSIGEPKHGDVVVFSWPPDRQFDYIKRVIGVPGDKVSYKDKVLTINGEKANQTFIEYTTDREGPNAEWHVKKIKENLLGVRHDIYVRPDVSPYDFEVTVPKGYYLMMGDNRDNSSDSRAWGFVPEENLRGRAFFIWMSWNSLLDTVRWSRLGKSIQ